MLLTDHSIEQIALDGGSLAYWPSFLSREVANAYLDRFLGPSVDWRQEDISIYGKRLPQPRLIAWYGDAGRTYTYSRLKLTPNPWTTDLQEIRQLVEKVADSPFNSVLLNLYRTGQDSIAWHADDEPELGNSPTIASVSLGIVRRFRFRHKRTREIRELPLAHGSLLIMRGAIQEHWVHDIPKEKGISSPRINLTFRFINR